ncbi:MAG: hypothetical protein IT429_01280 [Gemmataceae bacterium]|nr:hypothetical protein [Gemmataceae bacterium]
MEPDALFRHYQELQAYLHWTDDDARLIYAAAPALEPLLPELIRDFYEEIDRHPDTRKVITGGAEQIERLKGTLGQWLRELLWGPYDLAYVARRWRVGWRHVEIGLDQVYTNVALSRLRNGLLRGLHGRFADNSEVILTTSRALNKLLDLDLAIIEDAYQAEYSDRLQRAERLATIGQIAGGVAHELRNPLNVVKTSVYFLLNARTLTAEKKTEHLQRIERQVSLADGVITALSNFARMPVPSLRPFSIGRCVREALEFNPVPDNVRVMVDCPDTLPQALADIDQVRIVFANLFRNAREAMPDGGTLAVAARQVGDAVETTVADTGVGIPPAELGRVMEPLFSTKARGLGLGLAIARAILEKNRGGLHVASEPGRGSTFTVRLAADLVQEDQPG